VGPDSSIQAGGSWRRFDCVRKAGAAVCGLLCATWLCRQCCDGIVNDRAFTRTSKLNHRILRKLRGWFAVIVELVRLLVFEVIVEMICMTIIKAFMYVLQFIWECLCLLVSCIGRACD